MVDFQPLSNRLNAENIAREWGKRKSYIQKCCYIPPMRHPPPITPHQCPWRHYTGKARDKQADRCSPMSRWLVCGVCLEASWDATLRAQGGGGFPGKLCKDLAWLVTMQRDGRGEKGQLEEKNSRNSSPLDGGRIPLGIDWSSSGSRSGFWMRT